ncbi:hypothetical protein [Ralstonia pseudosolanacearum]|uniref:hypothetical protein n=1 Tax=Ralstonia pseudosolanacearum TaxID=1310165 RepID=UPI003CF80A1D
MDDQSDLPLALYKARLALAQRLFELALSARQRWLALGVELLAEDIASIQAASAALRSAQNWQAVAAIWPNAWWRINQHGVTALEGILRTALSNHTTMAIGTQQAVGQWQQAVVQALHLAGNAMPLYGFWQNTLSALDAVPPVIPERLPDGTSTPPHRARANHEHRERTAVGG